MKPTEQLPTCPNDGKECTPDMDGYIRCRKCERFKKEVKPINKEEDETVNNS